MLIGLIRRVRRAYGVTTDGHTGSELAPIHRTSSHCHYRQYWSRNALNWQPQGLQPTRSEETSGRRSRHRSGGTVAYRSRRMYLFLLFPTLMFLALLLKRGSQIPLKHQLVPRTLQSPGQSYQNATRHYRWGTVSSRYPSTREANIDKPRHSSATAYSLIPGRS